jgi:hypothetical protein
MHLALGAGDRCGERHSPDLLVYRVRRNRDSIEAHLAIVFARPGRHAVHRGPHRPVRQEIRPHRPPLPRRLDPRRPPRPHRRRPAATRPPQRPRPHQAARTRYALAPGKVRINAPRPATVMWLERQRLKPRRRPSDRSKPSSRRPRASDPTIAREASGQGSPTPVTELHGTPRVSRSCPSLSFFLAFASLARNPLSEISWRRFRGREARSRPRHEPS